MAFVFNHNAKSRLKEAVTAAATRINPLDADLANFLIGDTGDEYRCTIHDKSGNVEIVAVDCGESDATSGLKVSRGQEGTTAPTDGWPAGAILQLEPTAAVMDSFVQKAGVRQVAYNPNGVLTPQYFGEKVYQTDEKLWWKSVAASGTVWRLIAGTKQVATPAISPAAGTYNNGQTVTITCSTPSATIRYTTDGTDPTEASTEYTGTISLPYNATTTVKAKAFHADRWWTDSAVASASYTTTMSWSDLTSYWTATLGSWDGSEWDSADSGGGTYGINLTANGAWVVGFRPAKFRLTFSVVSALHVRLKDADGTVIFATTGFSGTADPISSLEEIDISVAADIATLETAEPRTGHAYSITKIELYG